GLRVARPERPLALQRRDRMHGVSAADRRRRRLGESEVPHLARVDELFHRSDRLLDRRLIVDAMLVVEIDVVDAEPLEARVTGFAHVLGAPTDAEKGSVLAAPVAELRREDDL